MLILLHFETKKIKNAFKIKNHHILMVLVPGAGLEPAWCRHRRILSPVRLPISPPGHVDWSPAKDSNLRPLD
jgi:hypothetical protein